MSLTIVSTTDRPDLVTTTATWRWTAFNRGGQVPLAQMQDREAHAAADPGLIPTVLVLLDGEQPVGMVTLCHDDLEGRPDLNPWMAGVYVDPAHRGKGHAMRLIAALEEFGRAIGTGQLWLYTRNAASLYEKAGWATTELFERNSNTYSIMRKAL